MRNILDDFIRLSVDEEKELSSYKGLRIETSDGKGNILDVTDTRTVEGEALKLKKMLKAMMATKYNESIPQFKLDQARAKIMPKGSERDEILALDKSLTKEYRSRKAKLEKAAKQKDLDGMTECLRDD